MNRPVSTVGRHALGLALAIAGLAAAHAAAAQDYSYRAYPGPAYPNGYSNPGYASPSYRPGPSYYSYPYERPTTAPAYPGRSYPYPASPYASPAPPYAYPPAPGAYRDEREPYPPGPGAYREPDDEGIVVYGHRLPGDEEGELSRPVDYSDLDLATDEGVAELRWRIARTAEEVCADLGEPPEHEIQNKTVATTCQKSARDSAFAQVRDAIDTARYWARR